MSPSIVIGDLQLQNALPALLPQLKTFQHRLHGEDFDIAETTKSVQDSVNDVYRNAGYLAVATSAPTTSAPRKDLLNYAVDLSSTITPGDIYHVASISIHAQPPLSEPDLAKAANLKSGDIASPAAERLATAEMKLAYANEGYFDAKVLCTVHDDSSSHTIDYTCNFVPGDVYHYASVDASALALDQQAAFARAFTVAPGTVADANLRTAVQAALQSLHLGFPVGPAFVPDPSTHTVKVVLKTSASAK